MRRSLVGSLVGIVFVAVAALVATFAAGNEPQLGLDLQGGASVVLQPTEEVSEDRLQQAVDIIRNRVDALGVAEPDISTQGDAIVVQLPGVEDQRKALEVVGQTAQLRFRPVLGDLPPEGATTTTTSSTTTSAPSGDPAATSTTVAETTTTTAPPGEIPTTSREDDLAESPVVLPGIEGRQRYSLGPAELTGSIVADAQARAPQLGGDWSVEVNFTSEGSRQFDELAAKYVNQRVAIVLDGVVQSAPVIQQASFGGTASITGNFTEEEAKDLALVLRFGALPVELEQQTVQQVSPTLGRDSLRAGVGAGLAGLILVLLYILVYYRALGLVVILGLGIWGALQWSIISLLGETAGLALSLAGATGIIVSVGVTVDSYIVYFERLKDEIRSGKTIRSSLERGFTKAFRTILAADISSLIGAVLLYVLTVGAVRGFAFFLGLSTLLDLIVAYFFTRPMVALVGRSRVFTDAPVLGVARGLAAAPADATATGGAR